ncbi:ATP-binding protein [Streptomyces sp. AJS327]|uniref:ATP-binding protein n=1 Tax=Streptomyces sp. AJS327 TaxID=2545265 RepID=UPI0021552B74|nr:ATP-binding protein [Streptomyces sp. AJS327]
MTEIPVALIAILAAGTAAAAVMTVLFFRARQEKQQLHARFQAASKEQENSARHVTDLTDRVRSTEAEVRHLASARIPDLGAALTHPNVPVRGPLNSSVAGTDLDASLTAVLDQFSDAVSKERYRMDAAAQSAMRGATTTIQALLYQLQTVLQGMQEQYDDPQVAKDLLAADFLNEQALRRIQSTAVVCGAWPGLTRQNSHVADVVVGAMSRISGYERIQVTNHLRDPVGLVARAVEPLAIVLTELLANAVHFSHPELPVAVTLQQGNRGVSVIIDDAGVGMHNDELRRAVQLMSGQDAVMITELGDPPRTGFATVGQLVRQYGFSTHVEASPYGGVRAVVYIPGEPLLTLIDEEERPMSPMAPMPANMPAGTPRLPEEEELPRRRRRAAGQETSAQAPQESVTPAAAPAPDPVASPEESASRWAAFQQGTASGRAAGPAADLDAPDSMDHMDFSGAPGSAFPHADITPPAPTDADEVARSAQTAPAVDAEVDTEGNPPA